MRKFCLPALMTACVLLSACSSNKNSVFRSHANDYQEQANSVHRITVPSNLAQDRAVDYYPISKPKPEHASASKIPPGFYPQAIIAEHKAAKEAGKAGPQQVAAVVNHQLPLDMSMQTAWAKVSDALQSQGYQILDQDETMRSYYVLDRSQTNNKITTTTPIDRISLTQKDKQIIVSVLDQNNKPAADDVSQRILTAIQAKIS